MVSIKETNLYPNVIKELNYSFADIYIFKGYVISEIKEGIVFNWDNHAKTVIDDVTKFLNTDGGDLIYISNRINSYSVMAQDWIKFFKNSYKLKGYYVVSDRQTSIMGYMVENLFFKNKMKKFSSIYEAINWLEKGRITEVA
ncbi:hypothetical protein [uncultured Algibacter sp.]|uniref:hypothetical protein n=1 Tax=uncultured Algibacter sp. TaxID=298659 RepID=UPI0032169BA0